MNKYKIFGYGRSISHLLLLQSALKPLVGFGLLYDFVPQSSIFTLLSPVSHFNLLAPEFGI